ncbi:MAG: hypothetical protein MUP36_03350 [Demequinaceae bacterium]|nr:hypothetical protein [Demequinaceae bacterium]
MMKTIHRLMVVGLSVGVLALSACSGGGDGTGILSLNTPGAGNDASPGSDATAEEQALAFAQCMRDNGVDFPDPTVNADGVPTFEGAFGRSQEGGFDPGDTSFSDAMDACGTLMEGLAFGGGRGGVGEFDQSATEDAMLEYTECLRTQGLDVGDLTMSGPGQGGGIPVEAAPEPADPEGAPPSGVGGEGFDRMDMFARMLDQDPDDHEWIAANDVCGSLLEGAIGGMGPVGMIGGEG